MAAFQTAGWKKFKMDDKLSNDLAAEGLLDIEELDEAETRRILAAMGVPVPEDNGEEPPKKRKKEMVPKSADKPETERAWVIGASEEILATLPPLSEPWTKLTDELELPEPLVQALRALNFKAPTRIQADCIPPAVISRTDVVGAAETGSGKTLAFAIPVVTNALRAYPNAQPARVQALVVLPSRELAQQVAEVFKKLTVFAPHLRTVTIVGGLSEEKQKRQLKQQPSFAIGTPGRLLALMKESVDTTVNADGETTLGRAAGLSDLSGLRALVLDEADRLVEQGHFKELDDILAECYKATNADKTDRLQTFVFSATLALDQRQGRGMSLGDKDSGEITTTSAKGKKAKKAAEKAPAANRVEELMRRVKLREKKLHVCSLERGSAVDTMKADEPIIPGKNTGSRGLDKNKVSLPASLTLEGLQCIEKDRELHLVTYLLHAAAKSVASGTPFRCLLFVNAITYARRLDAILKIALGQIQFTQGRGQVKGVTGNITGVPSLLAVGQSLYVTSMHAQMQQKQRLSRLEKFKKSERSLLICTDVAARGLDLPQVDVVFMLQPPRDAQTFVHRAGRTARANKLGTAVCMIIPPEVSAWKNVLQVIGKEPDELGVPSETSDVNAGSLAVVRSLYQQALEVDKLQHQDSRETREKNTMKAMALAADMVWSDDEEDKEGWKAHEKQKQNRNLQMKVNGLIQALSFPADRVFPVVRSIVSKK